MKNAKHLAFATLISLSALSFAESDARLVIQANYDKISRLSIKKDAKRLEKLTKKNASSCFVFIDAMESTMDLASTLGQNREQLARIHKFNKNSNKIVGIRKVGTDLICTVQTNYDVYLDSMGKKRVVGTSISQDTWIKTISGWKIRTSKIVKESSTLNGVPM